MIETIEKMLIRIAFYCRTSSNRQEKDETIKNQIQALTEKADTEYGPGNYVIVEQYLDDGYSGENTRRPELDRMREDLKCGKWDELFVFSGDRLSRKFGDSINLIEEIFRFGKKIVYKIGDQPTEEGSLVYRIMAAIHDDEKKKILARFKEGKGRRVADKKVMASIAPYGYTLIPRNGKPGRTDFTETKYEINKEEAEVMRMIFHWVGNERYSINKVILKLQTMGIRPRKSNRGVWARSTLTSLLHNETFIGKARYGSSEAIEPVRPLKPAQYKKVEKTSRRIKPRQEWSFIPVPAILEGEEGVLLFNRTQEQIKNNRREATGNINPYSYLLSGKIRCSCGYTRNGSGSKNKKNTYYRCSEHISKFPLGECEKGGLNALKTDEVVWNKIVSIVCNPFEFSEAVREHIKQKPETALDERTLAMQHLENEKAELNREKERLELAYAKGKLELDDIAPHVDRLKERLGEIAGLLTSILQTEPGVRRDTEVTESILEKIVFYAPKALADFSFQDKREVILDLVSKVTAIPGEVTIEGALPLIESDKEEITRFYLPLLANGDTIASPYYYVQFKTISGYCRIAERW